ncbi:nucleotidyl transferase AbiEii/AbiGii toxin family protein [Xanthomonas citri pv. anacardii]|uniref:nucleotidyl transferase AbiEii/AbiGii toxin family protein n=3 Tax=Xanthomonas citri TaxID=346 RepID=UPI000CCC195B|nr:nucleotidyl transferase AbiEii/AbiGii toxin family protein [Xanthomonas citri]MCT8362078.1 nucleotidyl transferase AbiEii/AbiGii toxin family protein [Xanthomonas citri pv. anacardii]MCT8366129.1 nucleotidyl transferase AbiEii/AbiGii toxin family protein [Xanthomonas citri pv. anacardii]MCT8370127.1 nucleotidyl transferase AbiEii/AbiGii toxin family protein [Xanthomonas citri pv. anacardii]MCT8374090.1 nucleotidyl transferase AbiEii/AbiGii toxin family protein [Xanthomonas citri pv. anacardi
MKKLAKDRQEFIESIAAEHSSQISASLLEKDEHLSDALDAIFKLDTIPEKSSPNLKLVFCGGSSLSKGHGLIERMSEDADLKIVISETLLSGSRNGVKTSLSTLKKDISSALQAIGLVQDKDNLPKALNENRYFASHWLYDPIYKPAVGLRPHLLVEFTARTPVLEVESLDILRLADRLAMGINPQYKVESLKAPTVKIAETVAEKVLSFLRRYAQHRSGKMEREWDGALVRHIYDVHCALKSDPTVKNKAAKAFPDLVQTDQKEFGGQFEDFNSAPKLTLENSLKAILIDANVKTEYQGNLLPLVYGSEKPAFSEALDSFELVARFLIGALK